MTVEGGRAKRAGRTTVVPVVGIGASAGGLAAFDAFFSGMPEKADPGMAFVLVQHLSPDHKSLLVELVRRQTRMEVLEVEDGMKVQPNCAYIIPPNRSMSYSDGHLRLVRPVEPRGRRLPIDFLFRSLAAELEERAVCIVLSGAGSDGTEGSRAINAVGGLVIAQQPDTAEFSSMPESVIAAGVTDKVLPPPEMAPYLIAYSVQALAKRRPKRAPAVLSNDAAVAQILAVVRADSGHDFAGYKPGTVMRRIERRMAVNNVDRLGQYLDLVRTKPAESTALSSDLLIGVTSFFRDPAAFDALGRLVIAPLVARPATDASIRVWVPACSTGEEAYSIAMLLQEEMEGQARFPAIQIFATDIDQRAVARARAGLYSSGIAADMAPERLARFFVEEPNGTGYRVRRTLRDMVVFSDQDVVRHPPFSRLDLVSCRNVMIYLGSELHNQVLSVLHYALVPGGALFLGTSEGIAGQGSLFIAEDRTAKIFRRRALGRDSSRGPRQVFVPAGAGRWRDPMPAGLPGGDAPAAVRHLTESALLGDESRVAILTTGRGDILYLHGRTGRYLEPAPGEAGLNALRMARSGLQHDLTTALHMAVAGEERVLRPGLRVRTNGDMATVDLEVRHVPGGPAEQPLFLVILEEAAPEVAQTAGAVGPSKPGDPGADEDARVRVARLESELRANEEYLRVTVQQLEQANDALTSSNEELQSVNEELQSANEELETSKEELQSVNEELTTVNDELQATVVELTSTTNDLGNLIAGTGIATLFVDLQQRIRRYTPGMAAILDLIPGDLERPLGHIASKLIDQDESLTVDVQAVLDTLVPVDSTVQTRTGRWYLMGIRPYRTQENIVAGAVLTFTDTTEMKRLGALSEEAESLRKMAAVVLDARDAVIVQDAAGGIIGWNPAATRILGWSQAEALAMNVRDLVPEQLRPDILDRTAALALIPVLEPHVAGWIARDGRTVDASVVATALLDEGGAPYAVATTLRARVAEGADHGPEPATGDPDHG